MEMGLGINIDDNFADVLVKAMEPKMGEIMDRVAKKAMAEKAVTIGELAKMVNISDKTLTEYEAQGMPSIPTGDTRRKFYPSQCDAWIKAHQRGERQL